ncbi:hypothetical protein BGX28_001074 [Mortierella sp. GBA30]|nr:hypothetical protein BGX28_001074 [Mortierella sp. GBA30]
MVSTSGRGRALSGTSPHYPVSGCSRILGRRRMSKLRFRIVMLIYLAMGCIIPYYVMRHAEEELIHEQHRSQMQHQYIAGGSQVPFDINNPRGYRRRAFFEDLFEVESPSAELQSSTNMQHSFDPTLLVSPPLRLATPVTGEALAAPAMRNLSSQHQQIFDSLSFKYTKLRKVIRLNRVKNESDYQIKVQNAVALAHEYLLERMPEEIQFFDKQIPGTKIDTPTKTRRFRQLMDEALNKGKWLYEPQRDYPHFGGATDWNKKHNERDRDLAIDRPPFPEAGKYRWVPAIQDTAESISVEEGRVKGWQASRIEPEDFCRVLGPRHILLVGDYIHWQLHDSILYNMFDNPQACYGDLACYHGVGHPLCPLPDEVRLKFVRNDILSSTRPRISRLNETKTQDPVEMPWLRNMKLKDTVILGATHQNFKDRLFQRLLINTVAKIRRARPDALIIYRNNPVGHPECPSKTNGFNVGRDRRPQTQAGVIKRPVRTWTGVNKTAIPHNRTTFGAEAKPFDHDVPLAELLDYPLNWVHFDRQNQIAKTVIEASGGIYWNVATMTNMRPDGHVGGQDCLSYERPGPTDEWAVSLYNLFKTIEFVEKEFADT